MTEEEIKKMQEENAKLKKDNENLVKENGEFKTTNTELDKTNKSKDETIAVMKKNAQEQGANFKKFRDMSEAEKDLLSEKEKEILQRQEKLEEDRAKDLADRAEHDKRIRTQTIDNLATKMAKGNKDLIDQIKINLGKLNPELLNAAITEQDLTPLVDSAFKMTGTQTTVDPLRKAHNTEGEPAPIDSNADYSKTKEGTDLGKAMGLNFAKPEEKIAPAAGAQQ